MIFQVEKCCSGEKISDTDNHEAQTESYRPCSGKAQDTFILKYTIFVTNHHYTVLLVCCKVAKKLALLLQGISDVVIRSLLLIYIFLLKLL